MQNVPAYTYLYPGSNQVKVMLKNATANAINVEKGRQVTILHPAYAIPDSLTLKPDDSSDDTGLKFDHGVDPLKGETQVKLDEPTRLNEANQEEDQTPFREEQLQELFTKLILAENMEGW